MSISGISAPSIAALFQQSQSASQLGAGPQTTVEKASAAALGAVGPAVGSTQPTGQPHHRHGGSGTHNDGNPAHAVDTLA